MKYLRILLLFSFIILPKICLAKTVTDTITNWQVYKGTELLFSSNPYDCYKPTGIIKEVDNFKSLRIIFFRDTKSYGKQKIKLLNVKNKFVAEFEFENKEELEISKAEIQKLFDKTKVYLTIIYFDKIESEGILLGYLLLDK